MLQKSQILNFRSYTPTPLNGLTKFRVKLSKNPCLITMAIVQWPLYINWKTANFQLFPNGSYMDAVGAKQRFWKVLLPWKSCYYDNEC